MRRERMDALLLGLNFAVLVSPFLPAGKMILVGDKLFTRHMSEYWLWQARAPWHVNGERCPTWDDATECRCMLGGEA